MKVIVVDYGIGNVFSVCRALESVGAEPQLSTSTREVSQAERVILPGVGSFRRAMNLLESSGMRDAVLEFMARERPFLGICVGMQMLFDESLEFGRTPGLGIIPGQVERIPEARPDGRRRRIPFIGWAPVTAPAALNSPHWTIGPLAGRESGTASFYFVHSFAGTPKHAGHLYALTECEGAEIVAAVSERHVLGVQFHPERSGPEGLRFLARFAGCDR